MNTHGHTVEEWRKICRANEKRYRQKYPEKYAAKKRRYLARHSEAVKVSRARYRAANREKVLADKKKWQADNWEHRQAYMVKYYAAKGDKIRQRRRAVYRANPALYNERQKEYLKKLSPEEIARKKQVAKATALRNRPARRPYMVAWQARRRSLRKAVTVGGDEIDRWIQQVKKRKEVKCYYCSVTFAGKDCHIDHILALSRGGTHTLANLCVSCSFCNLSKNDRLLPEWNKRGQQILSL